LEGVTVVEDFPVTISGDTITYKADAFTTGKEKKLENVLDQLPGFEIDEDGQVKVQGKKVSKVLVEGKEFFDGDTKMATKNIPANAVDKVQVLRDYNEVSPLSGVNDSDAIALNVKLKEGMKNIWFGDISFGGGPEGRYLAHPNLFYYSPKTTINVIGDLNNIGQQSFTLQDYFRFNGGLSSLMGRSGSSLNLSSDEVGLSLLQNNRAQNVLSRLAALNLGYNPNKKIKFSSFGIVSSNDTDISNLSNRTYIRQGGNNEEILSSRVEQKLTAVLFKFSTTYTPNAKWYISHDAFLKGSKIEDQNQLNSNFSGISNAISTTKTREPFSVRQTLNAFYSKNDNNVFSLETNLLYKRQRPNYNLVTAQQPFLGLIPLEGSNSFNLFQEKEIFTNSFDAEFNYYRVLNKTNHLSFKLGASINGQKLSSSLTEQFEDMPARTFDESRFIGAASFNFVDIYLGIGYRLKWNKLTFSPSVNIHSYDTQNEQNDVITTLDKTLILPQLRAKYELNSSQSIRFDYNLQADFPDIQKLATAQQLISYNALYEGNFELINAWYHNLNLNYFNFSMFNFTNINGGFQYQKKFNGFGSNVEFEGFDRISRAINIEAPNENFSVYGNYERRFTYWKGKFEARWTYNKFNNLTDGISNFNRSFNQDYKLALETRFKEAPNVELGFEKIWNDYASANVSSRFVTNRPFVSFEAYFLKGFAFTADYKYNESNWEFKISALNLLNTTSIRQDSFSENLIGTYEYFVQPKYFIFSIQYDL